MPTKDQAFRSVSLPTALVEEMERNAQAVTESRGPGAKPVSVPELIAIEHNFWRLRAAEGIAE